MKEAEFKHSDNNAAVMILKPKETFKLLLEEPALKKFNMSFDEIDETVTRNVLDEHSIALVIPDFDKGKDAKAFFNKNGHEIFDILLSVWPFSMTEWEAGKSDTVISEYFNSSYHPLLLNLLDIELDDTNAKADCSVTIIKATERCEEWVKKLMDDGKIEPLNDMEKFHNTLQNSGIAIISPCFKNRDNEVAFMKENCSKLFWFLLGTYCANPPVWPWPKEIDYKVFSEWFSHSSYYPVVDFVETKEVD